jgi:enoyl-CoA hydratase/carnithine racemase
MNAKELSFTARLFTAKEAREMGLVNRVVPADRLRAEVITLAESILRNSLETVAAIKSLYNRGMTMPLKEALEMESEAQFVITDTNERLKAFVRRK